MKHIYLLLLLIIAFFKPNLVLSQVNYEWGFNLGNEYDDLSFKSIIDSEGSVIITGLIGGEVDFDPGPNEAWVYPFGGFDIFLSKYNSDGQLVFAKSIGSSNDDVGYSITVDKHNNIFITGSFSELVNFDTGFGNYMVQSNGFSDAYIAKYDPEGNFIFAFGIGGIGADYASNISVDSSDNIYLSGQFQKTVDFDIGDGIFELSADSLSLASFIVKYDSTGALIFANSITGDLSETQLSDMAIDKEENTFVIGYFSKTIVFYNSTDSLTALGQDIFFAKYDSLGALIFCKSIGCVGHANIGQAIAVNDIGEFYIAGSFDGANDFDTGPGENIVESVSLGDIFFAKYDSNGNLVFVKALDGLDDWEHVNDLVLDAEENIYFAGLFENCDFIPGPGIYPVNAGIGDPADIFLAKYDPNGNFLFAETFGGVDYDEAYGLAIDLDNNIFIIGDFSGDIDFNPGFSGGEFSSNGNADIFLVKFSQEAVGVKESFLPANSLNISPNPAYGMVHFSTSEYYNGATISIINMIGQKIEEWEGQSGDKFDLNLTDLMPGEYLVTIKDSEFIATGKLVIIN